MSIVPVSSVNSDSELDNDTLVQEIDTLQAALETHPKLKEEGNEKDPNNKRRNSSPPITTTTDDDGTRHVFMTAREQWLGYSRKSIYGPANLEAVIFASELEDAKVR